MTSTDVPNSAAARTQLLEWIEEGHLAPAQAPEAFILAAPGPDTGAWRQFLSRLSLSLGALLIAAGVIFFFAYNWSGLERLGKLTLVQSVLLISVALTWWKGADAPIGRAALIAASLLVGATLAVFGQIYQTGADPWQLFALWAAIITPWAFTSRMPWLLLLWLGLLDTGVILYLEARPNVFGFVSEPELLLWSLVAINGLALIFWESLASNLLPWLRASWARRLLVLSVGIPITALLVQSIAMDQSSVLPAAIGWLVWMSASLTHYRYLRPDLFVLAADVLAVIVVAVSILLIHIGPAELFGMLTSTVIVIVGLSAMGATWLRRVAAELDEVSR